MIWRWRHLGQAASAALLWYLFPAWTVRWTWAAYVLLLLLLFGYGNVKYQALTLLFALPLLDDAEIDP